MKIPRAIIVCLLFFWMRSANADLAQLGDAMADVVTFGAWGQSRDLAEMEKEQLRLRFQAELARARNEAAASVATAKIEEKAKNAINSRFVGQELLKVIAAIDVLQAQLKELVVERFKVNSSLTRFDSWFDSFVTQTNDQLQALVDLFAEVNPKNDETVKAVLQAAKLATVQREQDINEAKSYLGTAMSGAKADTVASAMKTLVNIRASLVRILETQRSQLRQLVNEMYAEDTARRELCAPSDTIGVACETSNNSNCRYYSPDPGRPLPCNGMVYLNAFPVKAIKAIFDDSDSYAPNAEFFVSLERLGTVRPISLDAFRSPEELFGTDLLPRALLPAPFLAPRGCGNVQRMGDRLNEGFDYALLFKDAQDRPTTTRDNIAKLIEWRPLVEFWLESLKSTIPSVNSCKALPPATRGKLQKLVAAVEAIELFGSALTTGPLSITDNSRTLEPVGILANDF
jgi:hypothetical protein